MYPRKKTRMHFHFMPTKMSYYYTTAWEIEVKCRVASSDHRFPSLRWHCTCSVA